MSDSIEIELKFQMAKDSWYRIVESHYADNCLVSDKWLDSSNTGVPYYRGAAVKAAETINHFQLKWWENKIPPATQLKIDLLSIFYIALSDHTRLVHQESLPHPQAFDIIEETSRHLCEINSCKKRYAPVGTAREAHNKNIYYQPSVVELLEMFIAETLKQGLCQMSLLCACFQSIGMQPNEVIGMYFGRKALNILRDNNGYSQNDPELYARDWDGEEDYMVLQGHIEDEAKRGAFFTKDSLLETLKKTYFEKTGKQPK